MKTILATLILSTSQVVSVYDADTFFVDLPCNISVACDRVGIRVRGVDAPEIRGKCQREKINAYTARDYVSDAIKGSKAIELRNVERGKYYRLVADVYIDGQLLSNMLVDRGLARSYYGGKRKGWCD